MLGAALDGLPKVGEEKYDKLMGVLKKRFEPYGEIRDGCFWMPKGDDGVTKGYAFIEYSKREVRISVSSSYFLCDGHLRVQSERDVWCLHHISWCASVHAPDMATAECVACILKDLAVENSHVSDVRDLWGMLD